MGEAALRNCLSEPERLQRTAAARSDVISLAGGLPDPGLFPRRKLALACADALSLPGSPGLQYAWPEGYVELRRAVSQRLSLRGVSLDADRVLITSGAQQAISVALDACLKPGERVGVDAYSYPGALDALRAAGATITDLTSSAAAYYVMPAVSNPEGRSMTAQERAGLLTRARREGAWLLEDDAYAETRFDGRLPEPLLARDPEHVFYIGTFSKTLCPGLRVGWLVPPPDMLEACLRSKQASDLQTGSLTQIIVERYLARGDFDAHLRHIRRSYRRRALALASALAKLLPGFEFTAPAGGFSLWVRAKLAIDESRLLEVALERGVSFDAGRPFCSGGETGLHLRLAYSAIAEPQIEPAVERLAKAILAC